jgi:hypothetical protein
VTLNILNDKEKHRRIYLNYGKYKYALLINKKQRYRMVIDILIIYRVLSKKYLYAFIDNSAYSKTSRFILNIYINRKYLARVLAYKFSAAIIYG